MIEGINVEMLRRYVEMREKFETEAKTIESLASLLALLQDCGDDRLTVNPVALGYVHTIIEQSILNIWEQLDNFIYLVEARQALEEMD